MRALLLALVGLGAACAGPLRFSEHAIVWRETDDAPVARPAPREAHRNWPALQQTVFLPLDRALALEHGHEAEEVNAFDEVPDSTWYLDPRRDPRDPAGPPLELGAERLARGAVSDDDLPRLPLVVVRGRSVSAGASLGFIARDARGLRYMIKLDPRDHPGLATSTEVVATRLAWACGWRVPAIALISLRPEDLGVAADATARDRWDRVRPFGQAELGQVLAQSAVRADGSYQALASRWLPGVSLGPFASVGTRGDDPNDRVPHQHRRSLRAFGIFAAFINDADAVEANTLDMYVGTAGQGHVVHYQQDLGGSFGSWAIAPMASWLGYEAYVDPPRILGALFSFGFLPRGWESAEFKAAHQARLLRWPELGGFDAERFNPPRWRASLLHPAFARMTARDRYWGAKRLAAFSAEELRGAISAGWYRPAVAERLFAVLWERRRRILRAYLGPLTALDYLRLEAARLCFEDVWLRAGLGGEARYVAEEGGERLAITPGPRMGGCVAIPDRDGYRVLTLRVSRPELRRDARPLRVHLLQRDGQRRILGIER